MIDIFSLLLFTSVSSPWFLAPFSAPTTCVGFGSWEVHRERASAPCTLEVARWYQRLRDSGWQRSEVCLRGCQIILPLTLYLPDLELLVWGKDQVLTMEGFPMPPSCILSGPWTVSAQPLRKITCYKTIHIVTLHSNLKFTMWFRCWSHLHSHMR